MSVPRKKDSDKIKEHVARLKRQPWLGPARSWGPDFLFRFDDIESAAKILNSGRLLSRVQAKAEGVMGLDCASPNVISSTAEQWKAYVRLYFRPRSPTQFVTEGFRPVDKLQHGGAHCPVPVIMLFNAAEILTRADSRFSDGNLAANADVGDDARFLEAIPFEKVYHNKRFEQTERGSIIFHRHAEVIVPNALDLSSLRYIVCRTQAEYETLMYLLGPQARKRWSNQISLGGKASLHIKHWTFAEAVELSRTEIRIKFNPSSETPGPFHARLQVGEEATGKEYAWENVSFQANNTLSVSIQNLRYPESYSVRLELDDHLAYLNHYHYQEEEDIPF